MGGESRISLQAVLPAFAAELVGLLSAEDRPDLANQIKGLRIYGRCGCDDDFCSSFYTAPNPGRPWRDLGEHYSFVPIVSEGMVVLDVVDGSIRYVEVLDRPEVKRLVETLQVVADPDSALPDA